jgi:quercetin dioxygenase-like cupin family protein
VNKETAAFNSSAVAAERSVAAELSVATTVRVLPDDPSIMPLPLVEEGGTAWAVAWPGVGAHLRSMHRFSLDGGGRTRRMAHPMEAVYYVISGVALIEGVSIRKDWTLPAGSMALVHPGTPYRFRGLDGGAEIVGGPCPADPGVYAELGTNLTRSGKGIDLFHRDRPDLMMPMIARDARLVVWAGRGSQTANMNYVDMQPGERNIPHIHAGSEDTLYVLDGKGTIEDLTNGVEIPFEAPCVVHVPLGVMHAVKADRGSHIESVGGPAPADWNMLVRVGGYQRINR